MVAGLDSTVFINEFHYDNVGKDTGEFIEIANTAGTDLTGWSIVLYSGSGGKAYGTYALTGSANLTVLNLKADGLQNATKAPDGIALVNADKQVVQFLSYEGSFTARDGVAAELTSTDIGVSETNEKTELGHSLQLTGSGSTYGDFKWAGASLATGGKSNNDQDLRDFKIEQITLIGEKGEDKLVGSNSTRDLLVGMSGNDSLFGNGQDDFILGNRDDDYLDGGDGNDTLYGGTQNDTLYGGNGNDRLNGDKNDDKLFGGDGADTFVYNKAFGNDYLGDFQDGVDHIEFSVKVFKSFDQVKEAMSQQGEDVYIKDASGNTLTIAHVTTDMLTESDFLFV